MKFVVGKTEEWLQDLEARLSNDPRSIMGEIGLDRVAVTPETGVCEYEKQLEVKEIRVFLL